MAVHVEGLRLPNRPVRRLFLPALGWAAVAGVLAMIRRITREPSLPRMSDHWLASRRDTNEF